MSVSPFTVPEDIFVGCTSPIAIITYVPYWALLSSDECEWHLRSCSGNTASEIVWE
ncbi:hypothetical protein CYLTODRAFT_146812 [Cylindrobasidium torrendii FP15055 ss-10]|uniref:Uncharacterized protein n=1 Tax=Cylindrobasidium torrendii FP15055 ss-10 TaxID=1314674 RepID=A0A0D7AY89_9AGAR|nr:hypothetical protein CYLTODRAFT_146812 [Cylindrobasidium torrendii FP15055 ss-10]